LVAPGFGNRGIEGKIVAVQYARENNLPFFGICLGMQMAVIEFARNVIGLKGAHSTEMDPNSPEPVINMMEEQKAITMMGGTMRLGSYPCTITENTLAHKIYGTSSINERHRHRYEVNNHYVDQLIKAGLTISARTPFEQLCEIIELPQDQHPWFIGCQFHPEFTSNPRTGHPLFKAYIQAALKYKQSKGSAS